MAEAQKLSEMLNKYDSKNILHGHVMSIIQNDIELELFSDKRHSKNRFCSFTVTAGDGTQAFKDRIFLGIVGVGDNFIYNQFGEFFPHCC